MAKKKERALLWNPLPNIWGMCIRGSLCLFFPVSCFLFPLACLQAKGPRASRQLLWLFEEPKLKNHVHAFLFVCLFFHAFLLLQPRVYKCRWKYFFLCALLLFPLIKHTITWISNLSPSAKSFYPRKCHAFHPQIFIKSQLTRMILG